jgi:hypothetical protein
MASERFACLLDMATNNLFSQRRSKILRGSIFKDDREEETVVTVGDYRTGSDMKRAQKRPSHSTINALFWREILFKKFGGVTWDKTQLHVIFFFN